MGRNKPHRRELQLKTKLKKDPGVPRLPSLRVRNAEKERAHFHPGPHRLDADVQMATEPTLSSLAMLAGTSTPSEYASPLDPSSSTGALKTKEQLRRHYIRALHKVIDDSDIIILVLDARDPEGCRSRLVEEEVRRRESDGKKLVFVLNKIDLVPRENAQQWLRYLRHTTPTLPFRSANSNQRTKLSSSTAPALVRLLKAYKPSAAQSVTVGVVGYPNVGKSSLINTLKRSKACAVAAQPGHTRDLQTVQLERGLRIIDSPGVVFDEDDFVDDGKGKERARNNMLLRNVVKVEDIEDPIALVEEILGRTDHAVLKKIYNLPQIGSTLEFLTMLALTAGRLLKGGTPDVLAAARQVLTDWNHQKIPYFSAPPVIHPSSLPSMVVDGGQRIVAPGAENVGQAQIVSGFSQPFTLEGLFGAADAGAFGGAEAMDLGEDHEGISMESDDMAPHIPRKRSRSPSPITSLISDVPASTSPPESKTRRAPKRLRRSHDIPSYKSPIDEHARRAMARTNPLGRHMLKHDAKKARRAATRVMNLKRSEMDVDDEGGQGATTGVDTPKFVELT